MMTSLEKLNQLIVELGWDDYKFIDTRERINETILWLSAKIILQSDDYEIPNVNDSLLQLMTMEKDNKYAIDWAGEEIEDSEYHSIERLIEIKRLCCEDEVVIDKFIEGIENIK